MHHVVKKKKNRPTEAFPATFSDEQTFELNQSTHSYAVYELKWICKLDRHYAGVNQYTWPVCVGQCTYLE